MREQSKSAAIPEIPGFKEYNAFLGSALQQSKAWMGGQVQMLAAFQAASERWVEHRRRDFERSVAAIQQLASCRDLGEAAAIQQRWVAECARSLTADWVALMNPVAPRATREPQTARKAISVTTAAEKTAA